MALTNAEKQRAHRERTKARLAAAPAVVEVVSSVNLGELSKLVDNLFEAGALKTPARIALREWIKANGN